MLVLFFLITGKQEIKEKYYHPLRSSLAKDKRPLNSLSLFLSPSFSDIFVLYFVFTTNFKLFNTEKVMKLP